MFCSSVRECKIVSEVHNVFCSSVTYVAGQKSKRTMQNGKYLSTDLILSRLVVSFYSYLTVSGRFNASTRMCLAMSETFNFHVQHWL